MSFETFLIWSLAIGAAIGAGLLIVALRGAEPSAIARATASGQFTAALEAAAVDPPRKRDDLLAAAVAAKHRCEWQKARAWLDSALVDDPNDGEVTIELGLIATYDRDAKSADERFRDALSQRADLAESITLHRAFAALVGGDRASAAHYFEEVEAPLLTKLTLDVGPGEPAFAEWFLHASALWGAAGEIERAEWGEGKAIESAPESLLPAHVRAMLA
jgi:tetratricopeptide (TPR) repeat protein